MPVFPFSPRFCMQVLFYDIVELAKNIFRCTFRMSSCLGIFALHVYAIFPELSIFTVNVSLRP